MITRHQYSLLYEADGQRIKDEVCVWRLFGVFPIFTIRREQWRRAAVISDDLRRVVLTKDNYQCVYCGNSDYTQLAIDHLIPQSQGGQSVLENLRTTCKRCNSEKGGRTPEEAGMPLAFGRYTTQLLQAILPEAEQSTTNTTNYTEHRFAGAVLRMRAQGRGKVETIELLWGIKPGGASRNYHRASEEYDAIIASQQNG